MRRVCRIDYVNHAHHTSYNKKEYFKKIFSKSTPKNRMLHLTFGGLVAEKPCVQAIYHALHDLSQHEHSYNCLAVLYFSAPHHLFEDLRIIFANFY